MRPAEFMHLFCRVLLAVDLAVWVFVDWETWPPWMFVAVAALAVSQAVLAGVWGALGAGPPWRRLVLALAVSVAWTIIAHYKLPYPIFQPQPGFMLAANGIGPTAWGESAAMGILLATATLTCLGILTLFRQWGWELIESWQAAPAGRGSGRLQYSVADLLWLTTVMAVFAALAVAVGVLPALISMAVGVGFGLSGAILFGAIFSNGYRPQKVAVACLLVGWPIFLFLSWATFSAVAGHIAAWLALEWAFVAGTLYAAWRAGYRLQNGLAMDRLAAGRPAPAWLPRIMRGQPRIYSTSTTIIPAPPSATPERSGLHPQHLPQLLPIWIAVTVAIDVVLASMVGQTSDTTDTMLLNSGWYFTLAQFALLGWWIGLARPFSVNRLLLGAALLLVWTRTIALFFANANASELLVEITVIVSYIGGGCVWACSPLLTAIARWFGYRWTVRPPETGIVQTTPNRPFQFSIRDLIVWTTMIALLLYLHLGLSEPIRDSLTILANWFNCVPNVIAVTILVAIVVWAMFDLAVRWPVRVAAPILIPFVCTIALTRIMKGHWWSWTICISLVIAVLWTALTLAILRTIGYRLERARKS